MEPGVLELTGTRVVVRDWDATDLDELAGLLAPERLWHQTNGPYFGTPSASEMEAVIERIHTASHVPPRDRPTPRPDLAVADKSDGRLVGMVSWYFESEATDWRRMGIVIYDESVWGRGYGSEALRRWTSYLFETTHVLRLDFATYSDNVGMVEVGRRLGFRTEAVFRKARAWEGQTYDGIVMAVLREEWCAG